MRQAHGRITTLTNTIAISTTTTHETRGLLASCKHTWSSDWATEEEEDLEEKDPEEPPFPGMDHDHCLNGREPNEKERQEEPPPLEENQAQDNEGNMEDFEPEEQEDPGNDSSHGGDDNEADGFFADP